MFCLFQLYSEEEGELGPSNTLSAALQLTEQFEDSLPHSDATAMSDRSIKKCNQTKNLKDFDNQVRKHGQQSDAESSIMEDLEEQILDLDSDKGHSM